MNKCLYSRNETNCNTKRTKTQKSRESSPFKPFRTLNKSLSRDMNSDNHTHENSNTYVPSQQFLLYFISGQESSCSTENCTYHGSCEPSVCSLFSAARHKKSHMLQLKLEKSHFFSRDIFSLSLFNLSCRLRCALVLCCPKAVVGTDQDTCQRIFLWQMHTVKPFVKELSLS